MAERPWRFGDVVRVSPERNPSVPQPDDRRWVVLVVGDSSRRWNLGYLGDALGGAIISRWDSMFGFDLVPGPDDFVPLSVRESLAGRPLDSFTRTVAGGWGRIGLDGSGITYEEVE